jgi:uncharacterized membrane protein YhaH (DUF805 family)
MITTNTAQPTSMRSERNIFLPHGRIGRVAYGVRYAITVIAYVVFGSILKAVTDGSDLQTLMKGLAWILFAFIVVTSIKRLHDMGYGAAAVIFLGPIVPLLLFVPGEPGSNAYGNPPRKPSGGAESPL